MYRPAVGSAVYQVTKHPISQTCVHLILTYFRTMQQGCILSA